MIYMEHLNKSLSAGRSCLREKRNLALFFLVLAVLFTPCVGKAKELVPLPAKENIVLEKDRFGEEAAFSYTFPTGTKLTSIKSSNVKVAVASAERTEDETLLNLKFLKTGKAVVRFTAKKGKEKRNYTIAFTVYRYSCPVASLKVGKYECAGRFQDSPRWNGPMGKALQDKIYGKKQLIYVEPAAGYVLQSLCLEYEDGDEQLLKNGKKYKLSPGDTLIVRIKRKKTKAVNELFFYFAGDEN